MLLSIERENIATPSGYIFVFEHEVLNKIILIFLLRYIFYFQLTSCVSIYLLAIFLHPGLQNMALPHQGNIWIYNNSGGDVTVTVTEILH